MKKLLCIFLLFTLPAKGQYNLSGTVLSSDDRLPVPYATVYLSGFNSSTYTDEKGNFKLVSKDSLAPDTLFIQCLGYNSKAYSLNDIRKKQ